MMAQDLRDMQMERYRNRKVSTLGRKGRAPDAGPFQKRFRAGSYARYLAWELSPSSSMPHFEPIQVPAPDWDELHTYTGGFSLSQTTPPLRAGPPVCSPSSPFELD